MLHNEIMKYVPEGMKKAIRKTDIDDNGYWIFFTDDYVVNTYGQDLKFYRMYKLTADNVAYCFEHIRKVSEAPEQEREEENTDDLTADNGSTHEADKPYYDIVMECQCTDEYDSFVKLLKSGFHGAGYEESFLISQLPSDFITSVSCALFDYFIEGDHSQRKYNNEVNLLLCGYQFNAYIDKYSSSVFIVYFGDDTIYIGSYVYSLVYDDFTGNFIDDFIDVSLSDYTAENWEGKKDNVLTEVRKVLHDYDDPSFDDELPF